MSNHTDEFGFDYPQTTNTNTDPTIHLNGTSRDSLVKQRRDIIDALGDVETAIRQAWPHGRDYYTQGPDALSAAQQVWRERWNLVADLQEEITEEALRIYSQEEG